ncbi:MAG: GNAT family N-acetyltransferase [Anaerolineae bacterium]|nr:GNAT family N-acetyltransferase [Anaerolineae bacterium]
MITLREAVPDEDYPRIADLISATEPEPVTADTLREWDERKSAGMVRRRTVAVDDNGQVVGYSIVQRHNWDKDGQIYMWVTVDSACRHQGIGTRLYEDGVQLARQHGVTQIKSEVRENCAEGQHFAEKRGFQIHRHIFESTIDLRMFDESPFVGIIESVQASGIRFFTLADNNDDAARRQLHAINRQVVLDIPGYENDFPDYETFSNVILKGSWFRPEGQIMAADGDRIIGLGAVGYIAASNSMYNLITGVLPAYRGRKIALALKLMTIRYAKQAGAAYIRTNNDSENAPMLAVNRKLGYVSEPGVYSLRKTLE